MPLLTLLSAHLAYGDLPLLDDAAFSMEQGERIGLTVIPLTQQMITEWELPAGSHGLVVQEVNPYGPADGVLSGADSRSPDIIIAAEGRPVRNEGDLRTAIREAGRNGVLSLTIMNPSDSHRTRVVRVQLEDK